MTAQKNLTYTFTYQNPELITPAKPTPNGLKELSDMDDVPPVRLQTPLIYLYRSCANRRDPVKVIKEAIAKALVYFYPLAGRLRKMESNKKATVDCNSEGVIFIAADADVSIDEFGEDLIHPPFPGVEKFMCDVTQSLYGSPLLYFQVTRLKCGGFVVATTFNHILFDGYGINLFMSAVSELARGLPSPSIQPVWNRHLLTARNPPQVTFEHHQYNMNPSDKLEEPKLIKRDEGNVTSMCIFDQETISSLQKLAAQDMSTHFTTFDLIASTMWRAWVFSQELDPRTEMTIGININARSRFYPPFDPGYYGNLVAVITSMCKAGELTSNSVGYAARQIQKAKNQMTEEYMRSMIDLLAIHKGLPMNYESTNFTISDFRNIGFQNVDYGWGKPVYAGLANWDLAAMSPGVLTCFQTVKTNKGENIGTMVPISLPASAMDSFIDKLNFTMNPIANNRAWKRDANTLLRWANKLLK